MAVDVSRQGSTAVIKINRPERRNALDSESIALIGEAFAAAEADGSVRAVVLTGAGDRAFCAGMDLKEFAQVGRDRPRRAGPGLEVFTTRRYPKPVIAAVNGSAIGGGFELMLACDMAVAVESATFAVPEVKRGLVGAGCSTRLAGRVPQTVAFEMCLTGDPISAARARELGLLNDVVSEGSALARAMELADALSLNAPLAVDMTKQLICDELGSHDATEWSAIRAKAAPIFSSEDAREGARAFAEKRAPVWSGR